MRKSQVLKKDSTVDVKLVFYETVYTDKGVKQGGTREVEAAAMGIDNEEPMGWKRTNLWTTWEMEIVF